MPSPFATLAPALLDEAALVLSGDSFTLDPILIGFTTSCAWRRFASATSAR